MRIQFYKEWMPYDHPERYNSYKSEIDIRTPQWMNKIITLHFRTKFNRNIYWVILIPWIKPYLKIDNVMGYGRKWYISNRKPKL